ncbi:MAG: hypothetical protein ABEI99_08395, partial [Halobaculum sp.]
RMHRTVPVSVVAAVVALHTVGWIGGDVIDWIAVTDTLPGADPHRLFLVATYGLEAVGMVSLVAAGAICYRVGGATDLSSAYRGFLRRLVIAGVAGGVVGSLGLVAVTSAVGVLSAVSMSPAVVFLAAVAGLRGAVVVSVVGLAGGALGQFRGGDDAGASPVAVGD